METTFISIHGKLHSAWSICNVIQLTAHSDLSLDARLLYVSQSIQDILGYFPDEVIGKSCWEYFHPDEIPFAQAIHGRSIQMDKAANLNYCRVKRKNGQWIGCECVFTVVHDVLVASTSIYKHGIKSESTPFPPFVMMFRNCRLQIEQNEGGMPPSFGNFFHHHQ